MCCCSNYLHWFLSRSLANSIIVAFRDAISCMHLLWISKTFSWGQVHVMFTEFATKPKNCISFSGFGCNFFNRKINVCFACEISFNVLGITSLSSKNIIILTLMLLSKAIGIFRSFVKIRPKHKQMKFCLEVCQNKHLLDLSLSKSRGLGEDLLLYWSIFKCW